MYKIRIAFLPMYPSVPLEMERKGERKERRKGISNGEEGEGGEREGGKRGRERMKGGDSGKRGRKLVR